MNISNSIRQAYSEVDDFLELLDSQTREKVPENIRRLFKEEKDLEYIKGIDIDKAIAEQNLKEDTLAIIAMLNLKYWCEDEAEKERLISVYKKNEEKYQQLLQIEFDENLVFEKKEEINKTDEEKEILRINNKSFISVIWNKIKRIFRREI